MLGAIIGDVIGSPYEFSSDKTKDFDLFAPECRFTDDSLMTIAIGCACAYADLDNENDFKKAVSDTMREIGRKYPYESYGQMFYEWLMDDTEGPYYSYGNGSAMRVSPIGWIAKSLEEAKILARWSAEVTHNHHEGIKGAVSVASAIYMARMGASKDQIYEYISKEYYDLNFTLDSIRDSYRFDVTCEGSVPQAFVCFLESCDFEDAVRNAVSLGGDGDTIAAIAGSIAEAFYGIPADIAEKGLSYLDDDLMDYYLQYSEILYN